MSSEISIKQLSNLSGFSISTVSKSLNNRRDVGEETKLKIQNLAKKHNYVPNNSASALKSKSTKIMAVVVPQIASSFYGSLISEIHEKAFSFGYRILILESHDCNQQEIQCIDSIRDGCVDGIFIIKTLYQSNHPIRNGSSIVSNYNMPIVEVRIIDETEVDIRTGKIIVENALIKLLGKIKKTKQ